MEPNIQVDGLALFCDRRGIIVDVLYDGLGIGCTALIGRSFTSIVDSASTDKAGRFLDALLNRHTAFNWQFSLSAAGRLIGLHFSGSASDNGILLVGATSRSDGVRLYEALLSTHGEWNGQYDGLLKAMPVRDKAEAATDFYDEISRINNELVTTQRELAQKNFELERLAAENARLYDEAQAALRLRNEFLSSLTHDLKTPLSTILGVAQLLVRRITRRGTLDPQDVLAKLEQIETITLTMTGQINRLLEVARLQLGESLSIERRPVDLVALARRVSANLEPTSAGPSIAVAATVPALVGQWDIRQLERLLNNLISNAIKYSPDGGQITVEVGTEEAREQRPSLAVLKISDQGMGIPEADLPFVFEPFHRARNTAGRISGTGIGLTSVRQIVEQHEGTISVTSKEGVGTTFTVHLPLAPTTENTG